jgi:Spy/CpxP family protein refolding chaperone
MKTKMLLPLLLAVALPAAMAAQPSPYAGQERRAIKSLPEEQVRDLLAGHGMGLAKPAELNGYPGPMHVLEHADAMALTPAQRQATQALMARHRERARQLGAQLVEAERRLDDAFARRSIDAASLTALTGEAGRLQAQLREEHLRTHLEQAALLDERQLRRYGELRGYAAAAPAHGSGHQGHGGAHR